MEGAPAYVNMKHIDVTKPAPFDGRDLTVCQAVFDKLRAELRTGVDAEEANRIAAMIVDLYRQSVREPDQLKVMIEAARGIFPSHLEQAA